MKSDFDKRCIIEKAKAGDESAFETLVSSCSGKAYNIAFRYLKNNEDAQDAVQESFIKLYRHLASFHFDSQFDTWFYRIVINVCNDLLRRRKSNYELLDNTIKTEDQEFVPEIRDKAFTPEEEILAKEEQTLLMNCISQLAEEHRAVIILRDINGFTYDEISEILDCSLGTVKSRISRARIKLREIYIDLKDGTK